MKTIKRRVLKSFLFVCLGLTIATIAFANVRYVLDEPTPPRDLRVTDWWSYGCELRYREPVDDGGTPIIRYIIESREIGSGRWVPRERTPYLQCSIHTMTEGTEAEFRVMAVNKVGISEPSDVSTSVIFKDR